MTNKIPACAIVFDAGLIFNTQGNYKFGHKYADYAADPIHMAFVENITAFLAKNPENSVVFLQGPHSKPSHLNKISPTFADNVQVIAQKLPSAKKIVATLTPIQKEKEVLFIANTVEKNFLIAQANPFNGCRVSAHDHINCYDKLDYANNAIKLALTHPIG